MFNYKDFPEEFWGSDKETPEAILAKILNEIRMPITTIEGYCQILMKSDLSDEQRSQIEAIVESNRYIENILSAGSEYMARRQVKTSN